MTDSIDWSADLDRHPPADTPGYRSTLLRAPRNPPLMLSPTRREITSPVFGHEQIGTEDNDLLVNFGAGEPIGQRIRVHGKVVDANGRGVPGALVEMWQANAGGRYRHARDGYQAPLDPNFSGCGRTLTADDGSYAFRTILPGAYPWPNGGNNWRPAHLHFSVFGTALAQRLVTQMYFEGDPLIELCPIVQGVPRAAVASMVASLDMQATVPMDLIAWRHDIVLAGANRSVFEEDRS